MRVVAKYCELLTKHIVIIYLFIYSLHQPKTKQTYNANIKTHRTKPTNHLQL